jgi:hypothetical protein
LIGVHLRSSAALALLALLMTHPAAAQFVAGEWVERADEAARVVRTTPLRVLVLDAQQRPVEAATVRVEQLAHDFPIGVALSAPPTGYDAEAPLWRVINAVSAAPVTAWRQTQPTGPDDFALDAAQDVAAFAREHRLALHLGALLRSDPAYQPEWVPDLSPERAADAAAQYLDHVLREFGDELAGLDVMIADADHPWLPAASLRWLVDRAFVARPDVRLRIGFDEAFDPPRTPAVLRQADSLRLAFVGHDAVTLPLRPRPEFSHGNVLRALQRAEGLGLSVWCEPVRPGGDDPLDAAIRLESTLLVMFASPAVRGIVLEGSVPEPDADPGLFLTDAAGAATGLGLVVDRLFAERFRTDATLTTGPLGDARLRAFTGVHRVTATLPDGTLVQTTLRLPRAESDRLVVLEPAPGPRQDAP